MRPSLIVDLASAKVGASVSFRDLAKYAAGISCGDGPRGDIFGDYASGADHHIVTDMNTGKDDGAAADPDVIADGDTDTVLIHGAPGFGMNRMAGGVDRYIGSKLAVVSDGDPGHIQDRAVIVGKKFFPVSIWKP